MPELDDWWNYHGETLCPCCGLGSETGKRFKVCADYRDIDANHYQVRWRDGSGEWLVIDHLSPHEMACERYTFGDLCEECEKSLDD